MRRIVAILLVLVALVAVGYYAADLWGLLTAKEPEPGAETLNSPKNLGGRDFQDYPSLDRALIEAVDRNTDRVLAFVVYDTGVDRMVMSSNGRWALIWVDSRDKVTGEVVPGEPGLGIGVLEGETWTVYMQSDPQWPALLENVPKEILSTDELEFWRSGIESSCNTTGIGPFTGYFLPWKGGDQLALTQSILHHSPPNPSGSMHYAFDFSTSPSNMFNIWASRPGTVKFWTDSQANGDPTSPGNYIVIEDTTTAPTTYVLYLHLAQGSIPAQLKAPGAPVSQGQVIGVADDTGVSTNHHLHFQVHTNATSYWGCSVDVRFDDVPINSGRPRTATEASSYPQYGNQGQFFYVSGNSQAPPPDPNGPIGGLNIPAFGTILSSSQVLLDGWADDTNGTIQEAQFVVDWGQGWQPVGPLFQSTGILSYTLDLCAAGIPDGPLKFAVYAKDNSGNVTSAAGALPAAKDYKCVPPPPGCSPGDGEVALFEQPDFQGSCLVLSAGTHLLVEGLSGAIEYQAQPDGANQLGATVRSVQVGKDVYLSLFREILMLGRSQTFSSADSNLSDNWTDSGLYSVAYIENRTALPNDPLPAWPNGQTFTESTQLTLVWDDGGGSLDYQARLSGPSGTTTSTWTAEPWLDIGDLPPGQYTWEARARNDAGSSPWGPSAGFTVAASATTSFESPLAAGAVITAPISEDFESGLNGWTATGFWNLLNDASTALSGSSAWWYGTPAGSFANPSYDSGAPNTGSLTSPPIHVPGSGFYLRYWSNYETESDAAQWDRRRVLVSADGGPFNDLYQLQGELMNFWLKSPYFSLDAYAGQTIRVRFVFETLDHRNNDFPGWRVDLLTINTSPPQACGAANEPDNSPAQATPLSYGQTVSAEMCPSGDLDFFAFSGNAGDHVGIEIDAAANSSLLDSYLVLLDSDGVSILAENDDEIPGLHTDSRIGYVLPRTGTYYVKLRPWNFPGVGGNSLFYDLKLHLDPDDAQVNAFNTAVFLPSPAGVPAQVQLDVAASDPQSGISFVEFFYHSSDYAFGGWQRIDVDLDGSDGWSGFWDTSLYPAMFDMALLALIHDNAGNIAVAGIWDLFTITLDQSIYVPITIR